MVRSLTVGIYQNKSQKSPQRKVADIEKAEQDPKFIIDGQSLAYYILTPKDKDHSWEFANGGDYNTYATKMAEFFGRLMNFNAKSTIVLPLPDGTGPVTENSVSKWVSKAQDKIRRVSRVRQLLEKTASSSRLLLDVLPPFMLDEIAITAAKLKIPVIYTRNNVSRFVANYLKEGKADAVIGSNSDYCIFKDVKYIPIDSFYNDEYNIWQCYYMTAPIVCDIIGLNSVDKLIDLAILLGDDFTEKFVTSKYNIYTLLRIKPRQNNPAAIVEGIVDWLNAETYEGLENTSPMKEIIADDPEFKAAIDESRKFFLLEDLAPEGDSEVRKLVDEGKLPLWALGISEGTDFWYEPVVDDYKHEVSTSKVTLPIRRIIYGILGRQDVIEHIPTDENVITETVKAEADLPALAQILKMKKAALEKTFYQIVHASFPQQPNFKDDPINKLPEPVKTIALSLRFLIAQCYTENQAGYTRTPADNTKLKEAGVIGAPPIDMFELRALAVQALCLSQFKYSEFKGQDFKPRLRRVHVTALYEIVLQHMLALQQVFGQKTDDLKPHRFYDGQIFAAAYDAEGLITDERFSQYYSDEIKGKLKEIEGGLLKEFLDAVLYPFPAGLFDSFSAVPRSLGSAAFEEVKPQVATIVAPKSAFANLMDSDDEEEDAPVVAPPAPVITAPAPPPPAAKAEEQKKKVEMDEDEEMAFLMAAAAANKGQKREVKAAPQNKNKSKGPQRRRVEKVNLNEVKNFNKESKLEAKLQTKQQGFDW